ncbi:MAG: hypothetical protein AAF511_10010 [Pseudomonadota bacterium]
MAGLNTYLQRNWLFFIFLASYGYAITSMTMGLWFGDGVNIFASYSSASTLPEVIIDANKVYWAKTSFLFLTLLLLGLNLNARAAAGLGATFWSTSLIVMFGPTPTLVFTLALGVLLIAQQIRRKRLFGEISG